MTTQARAIAHPQGETRINDLLGSNHERSQRVVTTKEVIMSVKLDHTIVAAEDKKPQRNFRAVFGLEDWRMPAIHCRCLDAPIALVERVSVSGPFMAVQESERLGFCLVNWNCCSLTSQGGPVTYRPHYTG